jgi:hypothetical protein
MLTEWYFCCCISANPSDTEAFLSILHYLDTSESEPQLLYLAFNELRHTDDRMQIYALPRVLRLLCQDNLPSHLKQPINQYFDRLLDNTPGSLESSVQKLIGLTGSQSAPAKLLQAVDTFVQESKGLPERRLSSTPYIDLKDFLPETFVLAVLASQLEQNASLSASLVEAINEQDDGSSLVSELLQAALENQFGRMAFRLAVLIFSLATIEYPQEVRSLIANRASAAAHLEPDLLQTYAIALFSKSNQKHSSNSQCRRILYESQTLRELRNLLKDNFQENSENIDSLLRRVGVQSSPVRVQSLPIFYWQIILWELASHINAEATADILGGFLLPGALPPFSRNRQQRELRVNCALTDSIECFKVQLENLLAIQHLPPIRLEVISKQEFHLQGKFTWLFLSPWITRTTNRIPYPASSEPVLLIRLMGSVCFALYLLQNMTRKDFERMEFSARLVAHASDIMTLLERRWNKGDISKFEPALT